MKDNEIECKPKLILAEDGYLYFVGEIPDKVNDATELPPHFAIRVSRDIFSIPVYNGLLRPYRRLE